MMIRCVYVNSEIYERLLQLGLEELSFHKPLEKHKAWFSKSAGAWIDPEKFQ